MPQKVSHEHINAMSSKPSSLGADAWRNVSTISQDGIHYTINSLSMWTNLSAKAVEASCEQSFYNFDEADCSRLIVMLAQDNTRVSISPHRSRRPIPTHDLVLKLVKLPTKLGRTGFADTRTSKLAKIAGAAP